LNSSNWLAVLAALSKRPGCYWLTFELRFGALDAKQPRIYVQPNPDFVDIVPGGCKKAKREWIQKPGTVWSIYNQHLRALRLTCVATASCSSPKCRCIRTRTIIKRQSRIFKAPLLFPYPHLTEVKRGVYRPACLVWASVNVQ